jgi:uncharacterized RmlC-like cupin family protein
MATLIKKNDQRIRKGKSTLVSRVGIDKGTVKSPPLAMAFITIPPGGGSSRDYHVDCTQCIYLIKGRVRWYIGPHSEIVDMEPGDFLYIPRGEIHGNKNLSDTESAEEIACHVGVESFEEEATVAVEHLFAK